jgi:diguanylate cyclase (GGDEF)-like protein
VAAAPGGALLSAGDDPAQDQGRLSASRRTRPDDATTRDRDQTASDDDQTASDRDQTASDDDQTVSDRDQRASGEDQLASDLDQQTADREHDAASHESDAEQDPGFYARNRAAREATTHDRDAMSELRGESATERERAARRRDATARARDRTAYLRDRIAETRDQDAREHDRRVESSLGASSDFPFLRREAARARARATADRERAAEDRERAAQDRTAAARERTESARERGAAARDRERAATDPLTGARARGVGLADLQREIDRARRTDDSLVLAFIDVDHLKEVNDGEGHLAGDRLLKEVASALRDRLRSYDPIMRFGGDEFICTLTGVHIDEVKRRFDELAEQLAAHSSEHSVTVGFAELQDDDDMQRLIARADEALLEIRRVR